MAVTDRTPAHQGLSAAEAAARLARDGPNELPSARPRSVVAIAAGVIREPMFLLLIASGAIYLLLGDLAEALALLAAVFLVIGITLYQEHKTERALEALRDLSSPRALVIRDGEPRRIAGREVVCGDLVVLREGDRVPADATVVSCMNLFADESLLTGESVAVRKAAGHGAPEGGPGGDDRPFVYSGTLVVRGDGLATVHAIGRETELGRIGTTLSRLEVGRTALEREVRRLVRVLAVAGLSACVAVGVVYGTMRSGWLDGALAGLTLAISMVPEEFPVVLTVFLALGAWRISRSHVLTRRIPAVETLGSATVLCVDKTGTLTLNKMTVASIVAGGDARIVTAADETLPAPFRRVVAAAVRASKPDAFDPMEHAITAVGRQLHVWPDREEWTLAREYPLSSRLLAVTQAWQRRDRPSYGVAAKGAPEAIVALCGLSADEAQKVSADVEAMARAGLRVLAVAEGAWSGELPETPYELPLAFLGLVGLADPVRPAVPAAIEECRTAHIRVVMITGDYPATAMNVARQIGLARTAAYLTGTDVSQLDDAALRRRVEEVDIFARMVPDQKLRLVTALKANGHVVAMTGDGVNDAPALKAADIGIAMGARGTDVAREAAGLVLVDDDFSSIVQAIRLGRRIYDNIRKATAYVLAIHVPIAGISLLAVLLGWPLILLPVHVIFMELIIDPASSIAFEMEPEEADVMLRPPRNPRERLFTARTILASLLQGAGALVATAVVFVIAIRIGQREPDVRTLTFATLIITNLALIFANRSLTQPVWRGWRRPNPALRWLALGAIAVLGLVLYVPVCQGLFRVARPHPIDAAVIAVAGLAALAWMEAVKLWRHGGVFRARGETTARA